MRTVPGLRRHRVAGFVLCLSVLQAAGAATNLVANGDFERADPADARRPAGWELPDGLGVRWEPAPETGDGVARGRAIRMDTRVSERNMVARWRETGLTQWIFAAPGGGPIAATYGLSYYAADVPATTALCYRVSFDVLAPGGGAKVWVRGDAPMRDGTLRRAYETVVHCRPEPGVWTRVERVFSPAKSGRDIRRLRVMLYAYWPAGVYWFDNLRLEAVPPPPPDQ
jgi:hypothetical protein